MAPCSFLCSCYTKTLLSCLLQAHSAPTPSPVPPSVISISSLCHKHYHHDINHFCAFSPPATLDAFFSSLLSVQTLFILQSSVGVLTPSLCGIRYQTSPLMNYIWNSKFIVQWSSDCEHLAGATAWIFTSHPASGIHLHSQSSNP